jgi:hypothetical protein
MVAACLNELPAASDEPWSEQGWIARSSMLGAELAQVGEWLKPTDCKSVPPSEVRRFESFPVHHV